MGARMLRSYWSFVLLPIWLSTGCVTQIHPQEDATAPSKIPFSRYENVVVLPLGVLHSDNDGGDRRAIDFIQREFSACIRTSLPTSHPEPARAAAYPRATLVVEPVIQDMTKKTGGERVLWGPFVGSSAILMRVSYTDASDGTVIASPTFYVKQGAWAGAWTIGSADQNMLWQLAKQACTYAFLNRLEPRR
jgi:hypothetical protein